MEEKERRIAILLSHEYPPYIFGGVAVYSKQLAEWLSRNSWKVFVIAGKASINERINMEKIDDRFTIIRVYFPEIPPRWLLYTMPAKRCLEMLLTRDIRVVLSNSPLTWLALKDLRKSKKSTSYITVFHGSIHSLLAFFHYAIQDDFRNISLEELIYYAEAPLINHLTRRDLLVSDQYIFVANHVITEFESLYRDMARTIRHRSNVIYPGVDYDHLVQLRRSVEKVEKDKIIIAYVGRLYYTKGVTHALKTVENLVEEGHKRDVELWIFGKGPLELWLKSYMKRRKLSQHIKYFKFIERSKLLSLMAKYVDVLLHPSLYEGAPLAVMEAQALGVPVITYDLPWAQEFIINGINGYRIPYPNTVKLAEGIVKAAGIKVNGIIQSAKKFDKKLTFQKLENVFNKVLYPDAEQ